MGKECSINWREDGCIEDIGGKDRKKEATKRAKT
jgi:hypothetical protein